MINSVHLKGRVVRPPKFGRGANGSYVFFSVITEHDGHKAFHNVAAFKQVADKLSHLRKGNVIEVVGPLRYRKYKDSYTASIVAEKFSMDAATEENESEINEDDIPF